MYHIHIDGTIMPQEFEQFVIQKLGFTQTNFSGHPEGYVHFEPAHHLTLKIESLQEFNQIWNQLVEGASKSKFKGYLEAEFIHSEITFVNKPYNHSPIPFSISRRKLTGKKGDEFRQAELHLTFDKDHSDPQLIKNLLDAGLYGAYIPKMDCVALVLTVQGNIEDVVQFKSVLERYLSECGGMVNGKLKEERAIRYKIFGITPEKLPEIAESIHYT